MKIYRLFLLCIAFTVFIACNKNNQVAKNLDGTWSVDRIFTDQGGVDQSDLPREVSFTKCKADDENCDGQWVAADGSSFNFTYTINDKGTTFIWGDETADRSGTSRAFQDMATYAGIWEIKEQSKDKFVITSTECSGCNGEYQIEMSK
jgi:hypothetical protein